jgi:ATP-dependent DNA helicase RecG
MLRSELLELISYGENSGLEFKRDDIRPEQLAKEVVAFANVQGGRILLGVEDDGRVSGVQRLDVQEWVLNVFRDKVHPLIIPFYEEVEVEEGKRIGVVTVTSGISKPYVVRHNNREDVYVRMGNRAELARREQQARLFQSGGMLHVEVLPVAGTSFHSLDEARLKSYLSVMREDPEMPKTEDQWLDRLLGLGFMAEDGFGNKLCSIAGLLSFGVLPRRLLKQAGVRVMVFEGVDKEYNVKLDTILDAPLLGRWTRGAGTLQLIDKGVIESLSSTLLPFISEEASEIDLEMKRPKKFIYPWEVVREVVVNALIHRDWTRTVEVEVALYADRLEVISPGSLQNSMTIEKMKAGQRSPRNPLLVETLRDCGYVDARGMGVRTKVIPLMRQLNGADPLFEATEDLVKVVLPKGRR